MRTPLLVLAAILAASAPATADKIYTSDGKTITDVDIVEEGLAKLSYKDGRNDRQVDSQDVLRVEFDEMPRQLSEAFASLSEGDTETAAILLEDYVGGVIGGNPERRHKWAPAHAAWKVVELRTSMGDLTGAINAAGILISNFPDSRYLPEAYMAKAEAAHLGGEAAIAQATLRDFQSIIATRALSERWGIECELALVTTDAELTGGKRRAALEKVAKKAGSKFGTVKNTALVAMGESFLEDALADTAKASRYVADALELFEQVIADPRAKEATLAGAYTGKGDCLFQTAAPSQDAAQLKEALLSYLRVAAVYSEQSRYVPRCLFYSARCFDLLDDEESRERAQQLYGQVYFLYPGTRWSEEAKKFSRR